MVAGTAQTQSRTTSHLHLFVDRRWRPKFRHRKRLLVPAYKLVNNPGSHATLLDRISASPLKPG